MTRPHFLSTKINWNNVRHLCLIGIGLLIIGVLIWFYLAIGRLQLEVRRMEREYKKFEERLKTYRPDIYEQLSP